MIKAEAEYLGTENDKDKYRTKINIDDDDENVLFELASLVASIFLHWNKVATPDLFASEFYKLQLASNLVWLDLLTKGEGNNGERKAELS